MSQFPGVDFVDFQLIWDSIVFLKEYLSSTEGDEMGNGRQNQLPKNSSFRTRDRNIRERSHAQLKKIGEGIQGARNSCYLDTLLFSFFFESKIFDGLLSPKQTDDEFGRKIRHILQSVVVEPLRQKNRYCSADQVEKLRLELQHIDSKIMGSFMAPEDIIYLVLERILKEDKFIRYAGGHSDFMHIMTVDWRDKLCFTNVQNCFANSLRIYGNIKFAKVPTPALIIGLPWNNGKLVKYDGIVPNLMLNIENFMQQVVCSECEAPSAWESVEEVPKYFCERCVLTTTSSSKLVNRLKMRLSALICFQSAHFTCYVRRKDKAKVEKENSRWLFFNSLGVPGGTSFLPAVMKLTGLKDQIEDLIVDPTNITQYHQVRFRSTGHTCIYEPIFM